jgi:hypothetical protein
MHVELNILFRESREQRSEIGMLNKFEDEGLIGECLICWVHSLNNIDQSDDIWSMLQELEYVHFIFDPGGTALGFEEFDGVGNRGGRSKGC